MVPQRRVESINRFAERMTRTPAVKQELQKWGMELDPKIRALKGRLLPPEKVFLKTEFTYNSNNADWGHRKFFFSIVRDSLKNLLIFFFQFSQYLHNPFLHNIFNLILTLICKILLVNKIIIYVIYPLTFLYSPRPF